MQEKDLTPQQRRLKEAADHLLRVIEEVVPHSTAHYAVEAVWKSCSLLSGVSLTNPVITKDHEREQEDR